jgi:hypothetical protein
MMTIYLSEAFFPTNQNSLLTFYLVGRLHCLDRS